MAPTLLTRGRYEAVRPGRTDSLVVPEVARSTPWPMRTWDLLVVVGPPSTRVVITTCPASPGCAPAVARTWKTPIGTTKAPASIMVVQVRTGLFPVQGEALGGLDAPCVTMMFCSMSSGTIVAKAATAEKSTL
ncbi:hypothetical protein AFR_00625 [Actinoplanes friuliensis DSM 7358]|uniref:Uncharacterized protein n=1 Tax=Actinoplanes friuliensis DSM 7358 TaxID=1246995 RepID=U5VNP3_9ACTN|nr:hypothetical protein AFR_00625 [Actinoplanes friuliensis DSM 7358]